MYKKQTNKTNFRQTNENYRIPLKKVNVHNNNRSGIDFTGDVKERTRPIDILCGQETVVSGRTTGVNPLVRLTRSGSKGDQDLPSLPVFRTRGTGTRPSRRR